MKLTLQSTLKASMAEVFIGETKLLLEIISGTYKMPQFVNLPHTLMAGCLYILKSMFRYFSAAC